jgi:hypothetical protein
VAERGRRRRIRRRGRCDWDSNGTACHRPPGEMKGSIRYGPNIGPNVLYTVTSSISHLLASYKANEDRTAHQVVKRYMR